MFSTVLPHPTLPQFHDETPSLDSDGLQGDVAQCAEESWRILRVRPLDVVIGRGAFVLATLRGLDDREEEEQFMLRCPVYVRCETRCPRNRDSYFLHSNWSLQPIAMGISRPGRLHMSAQKRFRSLSGSRRKHTPNSMPCAPTLRALLPSPTATPASSVPLVTTLRTFKRLLGHAQPSQISATTPAWRLARSSSMSACSVVPRRSASHPPHRTASDVFDGHRCARPTYRSVDEGPRSGRWPRSLIQRSTGRALNPPSRRPGP